ncbi:MAG: HlyD family efflux transporter periplasmic adaptor subunit [Bacteroidia bacterium]|nr:HlyD family efflux transporter periplasmic adaptor subunit [Bacteroidia bacterium]
MNPIQSIRIHQKLPSGGWIAGVLFIVLLLTSCKSDTNEAFASGYFEAVETIVSARGNGTIQYLNVEEGMDLQADTKVGQIDSTQIYLTIRQIQAQKGAVLSRKPDISSQTAILKEQLAHANRELIRVENLNAGGAATQKQLDDARSAVAVLNRQLSAQQTTLDKTSASVGKETNPLEVQISLLQDQLEKCRIINPVTGTVLVKYAEPTEMTAIGRPLYKIADLSTLQLRAYITGKQLGSLKLGQKVKVTTDLGKEKPAEYEGTVNWISNKAEFTPKTIQTHEERSNEVFAIKVAVKNDGFLKIGMYGEIAPPNLPNTEAIKE